MLGGCSGADLATGSGVLNGTDRISIHNGTATFVTLRTGDDVDYVGGTGPPSFAFTPLAASTDNEFHVVIWSHGPVTFRCRWCPRRMRWRAVVRILIAVRRVPIPGKEDGAGGTSPVFCRRVRSATSPGLPDSWCNCCWHVWLSVGRMRSSKDGEGVECAFLSVTVVCLGFGGVSSLDSGVRRARWGGCGQLVRFVSGSGKNAAS
jgi:hypothetical protein